MAKNKNKDKSAGKKGNQNTETMNATGANDQMPSANSQKGSQGKNQKNGQEYQ